MLDCRPAPERSVLNLLEWTGNNACIARDETAYLEQQTDLMSVVHPTDDALDRVEEFLEDAWIRFRRSARQVGGMLTHLELGKGSLVCLEEPPACNLA